MSKRVREPQTSGSPAVDILTDEAQPGLRIRAEGTGNALEIVGSGGVLFSIDKNGVPSAGGGGGSQVLADVTLGSDGPQFSTPTLSLTGWFLVRVIAQLQAAQAGEGAGAWIRAAMRFNGDAGANYIWGTQALDGTFVNQGTAGYANGIQGFWGSGTNFSTNYWGANIYELTTPAATDRYKSVSYQGAVPWGTSAMGGFGGGYWNNTAAITQITFASNDGSNFRAGSRVVVLGVAQA